MAFMIPSCSYNSTPFMAFSSAVRLDAVSLYTTAIYIYAQVKYTQEMEEIIWAEICLFLLYILVMKMNLMRRGRAKGVEVVQ